MGYIYSNQERETEEHALPNVEVFTVDYYPNGMETDYAVHCENCGDLMWLGINEREDN